MKILETERLVLREMAPDDYDSLCVILQDPKVMYAYEHAFSDKEVSEWLERQLIRYAKDGCGLWAVIRKGGRCHRAVRRHHAGYRDGDCA